MKTLVFLATLLVPICGFAGDDFYCDDPETVQDWNRLVHKHGHSDNWQRLHALWLGLCQKVRDGSIPRNYAIDLFEEERARAIRSEKQRRKPPESPFG